MLCNPDELFMVSEHLYENELPDEMRGLESVSCLARHPILEASVSRVLDGKGAEKGTPLQSFQDPSISLRT